MSHEAPVIAIPDAPAFAAWVESHLDHEAGVWIKMAKTSSGIPSVTADEAVDVGLCYGWISGQRKSLDERHYLQKYVPRRPRSRWSLVNVRKVGALAAAGRMHPSGWAEVDAAKADGRWDAAYASQREATVPHDLAEALAASPRATEAFEAMGRTQQYAVILDLLTSRTPALRDAHLHKAMEQLEAQAVREACADPVKVGPDVLRPAPDRPA